MRDTVQNEFAPQAQVPLAPLTTLQVGGAAEYFADVTSVSGLQEALRWAAERQVPVFILGGGSNVVLPDAGLRGLVVRPRLEDLEEHLEPDGSVRLRVGAGMAWDAFVEWTVERGYAGLECLSGIPGWVGAVPIQNVGAYGQEVAQCLELVEALDRWTGQLVCIPAAECGFGYRTSRFKTRCRGRYVVTAVRFRLRVGGAGTLNYAELRRAFGPRGASPALPSVRRRVLELRASKAMVLDPADSNSVSVGSFFTNPVVLPATFEGLQRCHPTVPAYAADGGVKLSAAWLIEHAGFQRGFALGRARLSERHCLAITNQGGTSGDVLALADTIRQGVWRRFGIALEPEPDLCGRELPQLNGEPHER